MDLLAEVPTQEDLDTRVLIHIEIEAQARADMADRFWRYYMQLRLRHGLQVVPILVNLKGGRPGAHREILAEGFEDLETARFRFRVFSLSGCRAEEYLTSPEPIAWALAALAVRRKVEAIDEMKPLADLASRVLDLESVDDVVLS